MLTHPVFNTHHTEHEMLRYLKSLQNKDLALDHSMISLGSCTMKLNATSEMIPVTWPEFGDIHPFAPRDQAAGYHEMIERPDRLAEDRHRLRRHLHAAELRRPGRIRRPGGDPRYHASRGEGHRNICLIPKSAHGTNPATAQMASMKVVVVDCDDNGNVDVSRPQGQGRRAQRRPRLPDDHLPVDPRRVRGGGDATSAPSCTPTAARCIWTAPTSTPRSA